ncbi:MAG: diguanylate cyclase [Polyangiaceae bacterium]
MATPEPEIEVYGRPRILVVDDVASVRQLLHDQLTAPPLSAEVTTADDGARGLRLALEREFDCVLCDLTMPRIDGIAFLRVIRAQRSRLELPVLLVTAEDAVADKVSAFRCGASDFVTKPFSSAELIARVENQIALARMHRQLARVADIDPLTSLWNRRKLMSSLRTELTRSVRTSRSVSLLVLDVDHFKLVNDRHGHPVGDAVLVDLARLLGRDRRAYDGLGRLGGEEFAVVLPDVAAQAAAGVAERIRALVESASLGGLGAGAVTISIGVAEAPYGSGDSVEALYKRADQELYAAKESGRNRVCGPSAVTAAPPADAAVTAAPPADTATAADRTATRRITTAEARAAATARR